MTERVLVAAAPLPPSLVDSTDAAVAPPPFQGDAELFSSGETAGLGSSLDSSQAIEIFEEEAVQSFPLAAPRRVGGPGGRRPPSRRPRAARQAAVQRTCEEAGMDGIDASELPKDEEVEAREAALRAALPPPIVDASAVTAGFALPPPVVTVSAGPGASLDRKASREAMFARAGSTTTLRADFIELITLPPPATGDSSEPQQQMNVGQRGRARAGLPTEWGSTPADGGGDTLAVTGGAIPRPVSMPGAPKGAGAPKAGAKGGFPKGGFPKGGFPKGGGLPKGGAKGGFAKGGFPKGKAGGFPKGAAKGAVAKKPATSTGIRVAAAGIALPFGVGKRPSSSPGPKNSPDTSVTAEAALPPSLVATAGASIPPPLVPDSTAGASLPTAVASDPTVGSGLPPSLVSSDPTVGVGIPPPVSRSVLSESAPALPTSSEKSSIRISVKTPGHVLKTSVSSTGTFGRLAHSLVKRCAGADDTWAIHYKQNNYWHKASSSATFAELEIRSDTPLRFGPPREKAAVVPYKDLRNPKKRPAGCDPKKLERHLSPAEFDRVFKMTRAEFRYVFWCCVFVLPLLLTL
jgi:hypothetical protein